LTRVLNLVGVHLGNNLMQPAEDNIKGYWEHPEIVSVHDRLLQAMHHNWSDVLPFPEKWWLDEKIQPFRDEIVGILERDFRRHELWGLKDPRLCRLLPLWHGILSELGCEEYFAVIFRNPVEVAASLTKRNGFTIYKSALLWFRHVSEAEIHTRGFPRVFVEYSQILEDWESVVDNISRRLGMPLLKNIPAARPQIADFLSLGLRHHRESYDGLVQRHDVPPFVIDTYRELVKASLDGEHDLTESLSKYKMEFEERLTAFSPMIAVLQEMGISNEERTAWGRLVSERDAAVEQRDAQIGQIVEERERQQSQLRELEEERERQQSQLRELEEERERQQSQLRELEKALASLKERVLRLSLDNNRLSTHVQVYEYSKSWRLTAPLRSARRVGIGWYQAGARAFHRGLRCLRAIVGRFRGRVAARDPSSPSQQEDSRPADRPTLGKIPGRYLVDRCRQGVRRHGSLKSIPLGIRAAYALGSAEVKKRLRFNQYEAKLTELSGMIIGNRGFIDLFHVAMGWSTPLFQRFQHMSLEAARLGGLALYGGHRQVDKGIFVYQKAKGNVIVFDALDDRVVGCIFEALRKTPRKKILRLQSIDIATPLSHVERFLTEGLTVVYEYIDEINDEITGTVPAFVKERHRAILENEKILVAATADKLYEEVLRYRTSNCILSTNGVDLEHWRWTPRRVPKDMSPALKSGKIVVGYHGALSKWIDYELLGMIADHGDYELILIGYQHDSSLADSQLTRHPRVHFLGSKSYFVLSQYAAFYDIGILPFKRYCLTDSVSPVKVFEYMACGKPVVTTDLRECRKYESCLVSSSREEFMTNLDRARDYRYNENYRAILAREAERNSWHEKAKAILRLAGVDIDRAPVAGDELSPDWGASVGEGPLNDLGDRPAANLRQGGSRTGLWTGSRDRVKSLLYQFVRRIYWGLPLPESTKEACVGRTRVLIRGAQRQIRTDPNPSQTKEALIAAYVKQVLALPDRPGNERVELTADSYSRRDGDPKVLAYYLPQFYPTKENDEWWGRGATEWNNVSRAVPQYVGHYQPRLPGELGYYDLRIKDNLERQVALARMYGVYGFAYYFYYFDGRRLLDKPLDMFLNSPDIEFPFCLCWANESWTRRFDGTCGTVLIEQSNSVDSYHAFIESVVPYMRDPRYIRVAGRPVLVLYRPSFIPCCATTLEHWKRYCREAGVGDLYAIGVREHTWDADLLAHGFDAQSEFHPGTLFRYCKVITNEIEFIRKDFGGLVLDYKDIVEQKRYFQCNQRKLYRAVMPMWDNTPRRNNMAMIFEGATPQLYKKWLKEVLVETKGNRELEEPFVFVNAWNEWGEGTYLEPDRRYGYAFLQATRDAIEETRDIFPTCHGIAVAQH
jgi:glycosyltransferase involved in cell wall biosynthesis